MSDLAPLPLVLFVEDQQDVRDLYERAAEHYRPSFCVRSVGTADEALEVVKQGEVAAVVMDVNLVGESGATLAEVLHEHYPHIPKAFLTAYDRSITHEHAEEFGMEVWSKPIEMPKLIACVYCLLGRRPSACDDRRRGPRTGRGPVTMPDVLRKITNGLFFTH